MAGRVPSFDQTVKAALLLSRHSAGNGDKAGNVPSTFRWNRLPGPRVGSGDPLGSGLSLRPPVTE